MQTPDPARNADQWITLPLAFSDLSPCSSLCPGDPNQTTVLVSCDGMVRYAPHDQPREETFAQNFLLTKLGDVWKISSDCFRFLDKL